MNTRRVVSVAASRRGGALTLASAVALALALAPAPSLASEPAPPVLDVLADASGAKHAGADHGRPDPAQADERSVAMPPAEAPTLSIDAARAGGGLALRLVTERFRFVPTHADGAHVAGEGHARLYVDGVKRGRIFEANHRIDDLAAGVHDIRVALYTNDDAAYTVDGHPVQARVAVRRGGHEPGDAAAPVRVDIDVRAGHAGADRLRFEQGDVVELRWTSDEPVSVHLHGYDIEARIAPHAPLVMLFVADVAGRFPVAAHGDGTDAPGGHGHARLLYVEIYPR